jgi:nucleoside-diphosphate-sugar epimerase
MRVLVIGGSGYIGAVFIKMMLAAGHVVRCLDMRKLVINNLGLNDDQLSRYEMIVGDIRKQEDLSRTLKDADAVVNLAAIVGSPACAEKPEDAWSTNVTGARLLARVAPAHLPLIQMSTCSVYGRTKQPICRETDLPNPITIYGETKLHAEEAILERRGVVLRAVTAYGSSPIPRYDLFVHTLICYGLTNRRLHLFEPYAIRPMIHTEDIARGLLFSLEHFDVMAGNIYNLASDNSALTKLALVNRVSKLTGLQFEINIKQNDPDGRDYNVACDKIKKLGFETTKALDIGLLETTAWLNQIFPKDFDL